MDILGPILPLIPLCEPPGVEHTHGNLVAGPALRNTNAKGCKFALLEPCKTCTDENILHITARYINLP